MALTDREMLRRIHEGNKDAMNAVIEKYYDDIYRFCFYLTSSETDSYDISQEVFLRFIRYSHACSWRNLKGYLLIIARNVCRDYFRRKEREGAGSLSDELPDKRDVMEDAESRYLLQTLLGLLSYEQREVIVLRVREGMKFREISDMTGCSLSTVKSRYRLGIERMKAEMKETGKGRNEKKEKDEPNKKDGQNQGKKAQGRTAKRKSGGESVWKKN